jgi:sulfate transport system permease protein
LKGKKQERSPLQIFLLGIALLFVFLFLILPLVAVFAEAFRQGWQTYFKIFTEPEIRSAILLTLLIAIIVLPLNTLFGIAFAWAVAHFRFLGKGFLEVVLDIPFSVSPVIAGLFFVLLFGRESWLGSFLLEKGFPVLFHLPGMILATLFVTIPFVARELIPLMQSQGKEEEEAGIVLGARWFQIFTRITLPKIRWGLLYGMILLNARALGEFGAVSVVSGHIRGKTNTIPIEIEVLHGEYRFAEGFALATLLAFIAIATLIAKNLLEKKIEA